MRWKTGRRSENVEDRRGVGVVGGTKGVSIITIIIALVAMYFGIDTTAILSPNTPNQTSTRNPQEEQLADFVAVVLGDTEDTWQTLFQQMGKTYQLPKLVLFSDKVSSACGFADAAMGPFYCPADQKLYIDLSFYQALKDQFKAPGDFAQAYVIAHEVGHHVQTLLGISQQVHQLQAKANAVESNKLSVRQELQADCFAGIWAHHANRSRQILEQGDIEEALQAATSIGDDNLQKQSKGYIVPDSFTHGTSAQRVRWFKRGIENGSIEKCDALGAAQL